MNSNKIRFKLIVLSKIMIKNKWIWNKFAQWVLLTFAGTSLGLLIAVDWKNEP